MAVAPTMAEYGQSYKSSLFSVYILEKVQGPERDHCQDLGLSKLGRRSSQDVVCTSRQFSTFITTSRSDKTRELSTVKYGLYVPIIL
jgi:hypothetical protein